MGIRRLIFWTHLAIGLFVGIVVLIMSVTGVILTYDLQLTDWANGDYRRTPAEGETPLPVEAIVERLAEARDGQRPASISFRNDPAAPATASFGRRQTLFVDPYTGEVLGDGNGRVRAVMSWAMGWHRWLGREGDGRAIGRHITGACNLGFAFLVVSGLYLWWPKRLRWGAFRQVLWFRRGLSAKARDWNWHHVIGFWSALPLLFVVLTGVVISYPWAGDLLRRATGGPEPAESAAPQASVARATDDAAGVEATPGSPLAGIDAALARARTQAGDWNTISLRIPESGAAPLEVTIDRGNGRQPQLRTRLTLDRAGHVIGTEGFGDLPVYSRARSVVRFGHTGEMGGFIGQTVAGLVTAGSVVLVWTGLALTFRRLVLAPLRARRRRVTTRSATEADAEPEPQTA